MKKGKSLLALATALCMLFALALPTGAVKEGTLRQEYVEAELFQNGSFTGEQTVPDSGITLASASVEDELYSLILTGLQNKETTIDLSGLNLAYNEENAALLKRVFSLVVNENPRLIYVSGGYSVSYYPGGSFAALKPVYSNTYTDEMIADFDAAIETALAQVSDGMSDLEKTLVIHDYLVTVCQYNWGVAAGTSTPETGSSVYNAYGALVEGDAVCQGYALAYKLLLNELGIECSLVSSPSMSHMWNLVCLDGAWYHVDVTWDDPTPDIAGRVVHTYFLLSDAAISDETNGHIGWTSSVECTGTEYESGYAFCGAVSALYQWDGAYYYIADEDVLYCTDTLESKGTQVAKLTGYWHSGTVWLNDALYFAAQTFATAETYDLQIMRYNLTEGTISAEGAAVSDSRSPSPDGVYSSGSDFVGLRLSTDGTMVEAVSSARRAVLTLAELPPEESTEDTPVPLSTPTELEWGREYVVNSDSYTTLPGAISWKRGEISQTKYRIILYKVEENEAASYVAGSQHMVPSADLGDYFSSYLWTPVIEESGSGTYYFTVQAIGDGINYSDSDVAISPTWEYSKPDTQLDAPPNPTWDGRYMKWLLPASDDDIYGYETELYYRAPEDVEPRPIGGALIPGIQAYLSDNWIEQYGDGFYSFRVRTISSDITVMRNSPWSEMSAAYNPAGMQEQLQGILTSGTDIKAAVQALDTESLATAMAADTENTETVDLIRQLEAAANVTTNVTVASEVSDTFRASDISVVGAGLNAGASGVVTLQIGEADEGIVIPEQYQNTVQFSMHLVGTEGADLTTDDQELAVPVKITLPIPATINPAFLVILHYHADGSYEQVQPYIGQNEVSGQWYATFVVTSFSDFAICEAIAAKKTDVGVSVTLELATEQSGNVICAVYNAEGKLLGLTGPVELSGERQTVEVACGAGQADTVKVFLLDENNAPLCQAGEAEIVN